MFQAPAKEFESDELLGEKRIEEISRMTGRPRRVLFKFGIVYELKKPEDNYAFGEMLCEKQYTDCFN